MSSEDPFERTFDDEFVASASHRELSATERVEAARRAAAERSARRVPRRRRKRRFPGALALLLPFVVVVVAAVAVDRLAGPQNTSVEESDSFLIDGDVESFPPPADDEEDERLLPEPTAPTSDAYEFLAWTAGGMEPVRYNPCRPIHLVVSGESELAGSRPLLDAALTKVSAATGLRFVIDGQTTEQPDSHRRPVQDRYGKQWAPVHVGWTNPAVVPELAGNVAGIGGSQQITRRGTTAYVTGSIYLDAPSFAEMRAQGVGEADLESVVVHELGHLVGLDHVDDENQIMHAEGGSRVLGPGDLAGLAKVGSGGCQPSF